MTKFQAATILSSHVMDCQVHAIGKTIRLLFTDLVTFTLQYGCVTGRTQQNYHFSTETLRAEQ